MKQGSWQLKENGSKLQLKFVGDVDGQFSFPQASLFKPNQQVEVELREFSSMNSEGIRSWIQWHRSLDPSVQISYINAPSIFVNLASIINGLISHPLSLKSFQVQYQSEDGKKTATRIVEQSPEGHFFIPKFFEGLPLDHMPAKEFKVLDPHYTLT
jgi:hypothetical protein